MVNSKEFDFSHAWLEVDYYLLANGATVNRVLTAVDSEDSKLRDASHVGEVQHAIPFTVMDGIICYAGQTSLQIDGVGYFTRYEQFDYELPVHYELNPEQPILCNCGGQLTIGKFPLPNTQADDDGQEVGSVECRQCGTQIRAYRTHAA